jgi:hypothetical protein
MMNFRLIKASLITLLGTEAGSDFRVVGYQEQSKGANETLNSDRLAEVFYSAGEFPKSGGSQNGPTKHNITFDVNLTASKAASMDLAVIENPASLPAQRAAAITAAIEAASEADDSLDEFIDLVYQILMDAEHQELGRPAYTVASRWVDNIRKDRPINRGEYVTITASLQLTCSADEQVTGETGDTIEGIYDTTVDLDGDDVEKTGVIVDNNP